MMGPKTLAEVREELRRRLAPKGEDPVEWLEKQIAVSPKDSGVLRSLLAVLKGPAKPKRRTKKTKRARAR